jgi:1,4-alpha-glucan branching enzyme
METTLASLRSGDRAGAAEACLKMYAIDSSRKSSKQAADRLLDKHDTAAGVLHEFKLPSFGNARNVQLVGQFNDWNNFTLPMKWQDGAWAINVRLKPGKYMYKYVVDGIWMPDMDNKQINVEDNLNSIVEIK